VSTHTRYHYAVPPDTERAARLEEERRRLEYVRLRVERAAAIHRDCLVYAHSEGLINAALLGRIQQGTGIATAVLEEARQQSSANQARLQDLAQRLECSAQEVQAAEAEVVQQDRKLRELLSDRDQISDALSWTQAAASRALTDVQRLGAVTAETIAEVAATSATDRERAQAIQELEQRLAETEAGLRFINSQEATRPAATLMLAAMEANGYHLTETVTEGELTAYFEQEASEHQMALRIAVGKATEQDTRVWDLQAETYRFPLGSDECLDAVTDFEDTVEAMGLGTLRVRPGRVFPKDATDSVVIPARSGRNRAAARSEARPREKEAERG
jgi:chromosome segregation ATPase